MKHIAIIGECMIELNGEPFRAMAQSFGGDSLNTAVYLTRGAQLNANLFTNHDIKVSYVSALGIDAISNEMLSRWQNEGVNTKLVLRDPARIPGLYLIQLNKQGERSFLYWRSQSAARYLLQHEGFAQVKTALEQVDMVLLSGISLAILPTDNRTELIALLGKLRKNGVEIAFDSNFRPTLWPKDDNWQTVKDCYTAMFSCTDLALVTFDDEQILWGDASPEHTLARLQSLGVKKAVVKLGKDGSMIQDFSCKSKSEHITTTPVEHVVDTTSAGDAFNGGFLSAYLADMPMEKACEHGNALAGIVIQHHGAIVPRNATNALIHVLSNNK